MQTVVQKGGSGVKTAVLSTGKRGVTIAKDFKTFISRGNVVDLAVALVIGASFTAIVNSLVKDLCTPLIGLATGRVNMENQLAVIRAGKSGNTSYVSVAAATADGAVTLVSSTLPTNVGIFYDHVVELWKFHSDDHLIFNCRLVHVLLGSVCRNDTSTETIGSNRPRLSTLFHEGG